MRIQRFFLPSGSIDKLYVTIGDQKLVHQIRKVLRLHIGDLIEVLDGTDCLYTCSLLSIDKDLVTAEIVKRQEVSRIPTVDVSIALPLLKGGRFEFALQKLTELGVSKIIPICCTRSVIRTMDGAKQDHFQAILREAVEQSEGSFLPSLDNLIGFEDLVTQKAALDDNCLDILCTERSSSDFLLEFLCKKNISTPAGKKILIIVGPEGGLTQQEVDLAQMHHFNLVSLGQRILRTETAAIYALAQVVALASSKIY